MGKQCKVPPAFNQPPCIDQDALSMKLEGIKSDEQPLKDDRTNRHTGAHEY